jgi:cobalt-zinc-cadmium efflux system protein
MHVRHDNPMASAKNVRFAFVLNLLFTLIEIIGGLLTNSMAILSDALHDLGDSFTLGLTWYLEKVSGRARTPRYTYGYRRFSLLGALASSAVLLFGSLMILARSIPRLLNPEQVDAYGMLGLALMGITVNGIAVLRLKRGSKLSERVVMLHLLEDVLGWLAVLASSVVLVFVNIPVLDPILSVLITLFVLWKLLGTLRENFRIFLQSVPEELRVSDIREALSTLEAVRDVHDLHIWSLDGQYNVLTVHITVPEGLKWEEALEVKRRCRELLNKKNIQHCTIEVEVENEECELAQC